jgi:hypothetical protein
MAVFLTKYDNSDSTDNLVEPYPELYLVYSVIVLLFILTGLSTILYFYPIECAFFLVMLATVSKLVIKRKHLTFFENEYDLDTFPKICNAANLADLTFAHS